MVSGVTGEPVEEVRVAMALNGGVSLAVWMGGCAVELDCARRAHAGPESLDAAEAPEDGPKPLERFFTGAAPRPTAATDAPERRVYAALCRALRRRLVLDVMSGASAGGINGALLGAATTHRRRLHPDFLRRAWVELGDLDQLLQPVSLAGPHSLMQGEQFHAGLHDAFRDLRETDRLCRIPNGQATLDPSPAAVKLDVTTTDVLGRERHFLDTWGNALSAREYRARFAFRTTGDFTSGRLAQAARASASFPLAFEPWHTSAEAGALAGFTEPRWVVDGGLLDNAPIRAALDLIPAQPAVSQVQRYLCYVNADPPRVADGALTGDDGPAEAEAAAIGPEGPALPSVLGYVANLPRQAPFVDQLTAIEQATRRSGLREDGELIELLTLDGAALTRTAAGLLGPYRRRRRLASLEELMGSAADAARALHVLGDAAPLPWIPDTFPAAGGPWRWGVRAAQRMLHLELDVLRAALGRTRPGARDALFAARAGVDAALGALEEQRTGLLGDAAVHHRLFALLEPGADVAALTAELATVMVGYQAQIEIRLREATAALHDVREELAAALGSPLCAALFGDGWKAAAELSPATLDHVTNRALAIELLRRALSSDEDIESAQRLRFAQLTPTAPGLIFTADPFTDSGVCTAAAKLTGIELGHFAAFYRRSWRANDFMWGRLDGAARVVEMLVDPLRATELAELEPGAEPWHVLAEGLVPEDASADVRWLTEETLVAAGVLAEPHAGGPPSAGDLRAVLEPALAADLRDGPGTLTRALCIRLAQLEALTHELPVLVKESTGDAALGSGSEPLALPAGEGVRAAVTALRTGPPLPERLGRNRHEVGSALALRTIAHAGLVTLSAVREARAPLGHVLYALRAGLLPLAGVVSRVPAYRAVTAAGFWAAAMFLGARMLSLDANGRTDIGLLFSADTIAAIIALLVALGVMAVPAIRARRSTGRRVWVQALVLLALVASGGIGALVLRKLAGADWAHLLLAPGASHPPGWVLGLVILLLAGPVAVRLAPGMPKALDPLVAKPWAGPLAAVALGALALAVIGFSAGTVLDALFDPGWRFITAWLSLVVAPAVVFAYVARRS